MLRLYIDDVALRLADERIELPRYNASSLRNPQGWREGSLIRVGVVSTPEADRLFGYAAEFYRSSAFNDAYHRARLEMEGVTLYDGVVTLDGVERSAAQCIYRLTIRQGGAEWADKAAMTRLNAMAMEFKRRLTLSNIEASWSDDGVVRFLPVRYDSYAESEPTGSYVVQRCPMPHDYYPFISIPAIVERITSASGYRVVSDFLASSLFRRLMLSGAYRSIESGSAIDAMGFRAMRSVSSEAAAGADGRVYITEPCFASNVGALVDTVNPETLDMEGKPMYEAYANRGCFGFEQGVPVFYPTREISVAFDIHLRYTTDYRIASSRRLQGFDRLYLGNGCEVDVTLHNNYTNHREDAKAGGAYKLFIFDYDPTAKYYLSGYGEVDGTESEVRIAATFSGEATLYVMPEGDDAYTTYEGDWALYDSYVKATGQREVELTVRTPFEKLSHASKRPFDDLYIGGAEPGQRLTLHTGCSIEPLFSGAAGYGEEVEFRDVANLDLSQIGLLEALAHMFNLCIYTHRPSKRVYIEPYDDFYSGEEVDWQDRVVEGTMLLTEGVTECFEHMTLCYQTADAVALRTLADSTFGSWSRHIVSYGAKHGVERRINPLFMPTLSLDGASSEAPAAEVLTVGDRDTIDAAGNLSPRVVLYHGMVALPDGQRWPSPSGLNAYPLATFHSPNVADTLCFEERDNRRGLHRFYDAELEAQSKRGVLSCEVSISPLEYAALFDPSSMGATIRSRFRLAVGGNTSLFVLDAIEDYDVERHVARCRFRRLMQD